MEFVNLEPITLNISLPEDGFAALEACVAARNAKREEGEKEWTIADEVRCAFDWHVYDLIKMAKEGEPVDPAYRDQALAKHDEFTRELDEAMRTLRAEKNLPRWLSSLVDEQ